MFSVTLGNKNWPPFLDIISQTAADSITRESAGRDTTLVKAEAESIFDSPLIEKTAGKEHTVELNQLFEL